VDVHRYQNNDAKLKENDYLGNREALKHKDQVLGKVDAEIRKEKKEAAAKIDPKEYEDFMTPEGPLAREVGSVRAKQIRDEELKTAKEIVQAEHAVVAEIHLAYAGALHRFRPTLMAVHSGKGSPEEIAKVLYLVAKYKLYDVKMFGTDAAAGVRDYCNKYIGLDCNGFVGNYARVIGRSKTP